MKKNIVFVGLSGCGKTTVGKRLAKRLQMPFIDTDAYIEKLTQKTVSEIFETRGEEEFRYWEEKAVACICEEGGKVIATGGGSVLNPVNVENLKKNGVIIFLDRTPDSILKKINLAIRPLLAKNPGKLYELDKERHHIYKNIADYHVAATSGIEDTVQAVYNLVKTKNLTQ